MGYSFIPFLLIIGSLATVVTVVIRKLPQLTLLDVENLPEVKEEQKKNEYLKRRVEKRAEASKHAWVLFFNKFVTTKLVRLQAAFRQFVGRMERQALQKKTEKQKEQSLETQYEQVPQIKNMLQEAQLAFERKDFEAAESKCIAVIRVDAKNPDAYRGLGDVYMAQGQYKEAKETFGFLLQISPSDEHAITELGRIAEQEGNVEQAVDYYQQAVLLNDHKAPRFMKIAELLRQIGQNETALAAIEQAVELEPQNPKYLDFLVETSILVGDKKIAEEAFSQLRMVNPENQKLDILKDKIGQIGK